MKKFLWKLTRPIRRFWFREFQIRGKKFYYGTIAAALLIIAVTAWCVYIYGPIGFLVGLIKKGLAALGVFVVSVIANPINVLKPFAIMMLKKTGIQYGVMPALERNVIQVLKPAIAARIKESKSQLGRLFVLLFGGVITAVAGVAVFFSQGLLLIQTVLGFVWGKVLATFGFKSIVALVTASWTWLVSTWNYLKYTTIGQLLQLYVFSVVTNLMIKIIPERSRRRLTWLWGKATIPFWFVHGLIDKLFKWIGFKDWIEKASRWIEPPAERKKRHHERLLVALERKKDQQKRKHPFHEDARINRFDARRSRKHLPNRDQKRRR